MSESDTLIPKSPDRKNDRKNEPINQSTNILLVSRLQSLQSMSNANFMISLFCLIYFGINVTLFYCNYCIDKNSVDKNSVDDKDPPISDEAFHLIEFWATFLFTIVEAFAIIQTPKALITIYENPLVLKVILFINIVATLVPALLVTINLEDFEVLSHELEYLNEITMSFVDLVFFYSLCKKPNQDTAASDDLSSMYVAIGACFIAIIQLGLYNGFGQNEDGDMNGERLAHYIEFIFACISSTITFLFSLDNMFVTDKEISEILYGSHKDCVSCSSQRSVLHQPGYEAIRAQPGKEKEKDKCGMV